MAIEKYKNNGKLIPYRNLLGNLYLDVDPKGRQTWIKKRIRISNTASNPLPLASFPYVDHNSPGAEHVEVLDGHERPRHVGVEDVQQLISVNILYAPYY